MTWSPEERRSYFREKRSERRAAWLAEQGGVCASCGSDDRLEVDHIDPSLKRWKPNDLWMRKLADRLSELENCQPLCYTCHRAKSGLERKQKVPRHGTWTQYTRFACRCDDCRAEGSRYNKLMAINRKQRRVGKI